MTVRFVIHMKHGWSCKCFSESDLVVNLDYALREGKTILRVEAI